MKNELVSGIGAALGVVFLIFALTYPGVNQIPLESPPELIVPIRDFNSPKEASVPLLFTEKLDSTGHPFFDSLFATESKVVGARIEIPKSPAAASVGSISKNTEKRAFTVSTKTELTVNASALRGAAVNILCIPKDGSVPAVSGSGVFIDSRGIIMTVAHVGQMYLLKDYPTPGNIECVIRTGSPARTAYTAKLIYISPTWIKKSPDTLVAAAPTSTGAHDFALLAVTGSLTQTPLPSSFPSVPLSDNSPEAGDAVGVGTYGAQYLDNTQKRDGLYQTLVYGVVTKPFTFTTNKIEALSVKAGSAAQLGSSGGGIINSKGEYVGLITNSSITGDFSSRELRAITPFHIRDSFRNDMDENLDSYLADRTISELISSFNLTARELSLVVIEAIN